MTRAKLAMPIAFCVTVLSFPFGDSQSADLDPLEALKACAGIENADERVACYDTIGERVVDEKTVVPESPATAAPAATAPAAVAAPAAAAVPPAPATAAETPAVVTPSPAEAAAANPALQSSEDDKKKPIYGHVRSCQETSDRRWFFILDSGDVWKQSGGKTRRFKDCDFDVVIRKDIFGYKMTIAGVEDTVRVRRHK